MNNIYRSVYCNQTGTWVAVSEVTSAGRGSRRARTTLVALAVLGVCSVGELRDANAASFYWQGNNNLSDSGTGNFDQSSNLSMSIAGDDNDNCGTVAVLGRTDVPGAIGSSVGGITGITPSALYTSIVGNTSGEGVNREGNTVWNTYTTTQDWVSQGRITTAGQGYADAYVTAQPRNFGVGSFAVGCGTTTTGNYAQAVGMAATATAPTAMAYGVAALASGTASMAMGVGSAATAESAVAIGSLAEASLANSVALGANSKAVAVTPTTNWVTAGAVTAGKAFTVTQAPTNGVVAVGSRQIQGVADGEVSATSTDAVNGSQLFQVAQAITAGAGGGSPYYATSSAGAVPVVSGVDAMAAGAGASAAGVQALAIGTNAVVGYDNGVAIGSGSKASAAPTGAGFLTDQAAPASAASFGDVGTERRLQNLADGSAVTDAVTVGQLSTSHSINQAGITSLSTSVTTLSTSVAALTAIDPNDLTMASLSTSIAESGGSTAGALGGGSTYDPATGTVTPPSYTTYNADGTPASVSNVGDALNILNTQGSKYMHVNSVEAGSVASGVNSVAIGSAAEATGTNSIAIGTGALATGSVAVGAAARAGGGGAAFGDNADAGGTPVSRAPGVTQGTAVGFGAVVQTNGGVALGSGAVSSTGPGVAGYVPGAATAAQAAAVRATTGTQGAVAVGDAGTGQYRQITGVAAGAADSDAVNVSQLKATNSNVSSATEQINIANQNINALSRNLSEVSRVAYSGTAMAFAMSGAYLPSLQAGEKTVGVGVGGYQGYGAVAMVFKAMSRDGAMGWGAGVSTTGKEWGINAGIGLKWQ